MRGKDLSEDMTIGSPRSFCTKPQNAAWRVATTLSAVNFCRPALQYCSVESQSGCYSEITRLLAQPRERDMYDNIIQ